MPPSVIGWTRLEPYSRDESLRGGLRAEVHDPFWLLARQWQFGEFRGEDVGSPVLVRWLLHGTPLTRHQPRGIAPDRSVAGRRLDGVPLETLVERERIRIEGAVQPRLAAEAGLHLVRLLGAAHRAAVLALFPLTAPAEDPRQPLDDDTRRFALVTAGRVPDGGLLYSVLRAVRDPAALNQLAEPYRSRVGAEVQSWQAWEQSFPEAERSRIDGAVTDWLEWWDSLFSEPGPMAPVQPSWIGERMEYEVAVAAPTPAGEIVLDAPEYPGGHLDWYSFDVMRGGSLGAMRDDLSRDQVEREAIKGGALPVPVSFPGMPASRWWEFEDGRVDLGAVQAGPQDLVRLLLLEFALVYGNDWFVLPVDLPVGSLCRVQWLVVSDTFGQRTLIRAAREVDRAGLPPGETELPWDMFRLAPDRRAGVAGGREAPDALFLPPTLGTSLHGAPLEDVLFLRDEMANLAWAVERVVESPIGRPLDRSEAFQAGRRRGQARDSAPAPSTATGDGVTTLAYRLATEVPPHWVPLFPVRIRPGEPAIRLQRGGVPQGRVLQREGVPGAAPLHLNEEEVPRAGARVTRAFQYARWIDGKTYLWVGRRKGAGHGEGSSGLRFDVVEPVHRTAP
jgi:hypothetical protein